MDFIETVLFSAVMGFAIFLSLPIVLHRKTGEIRTKILTAIATGILFFVLADIFSNASSSLYNGSLFGLGSSPSNDAVFIATLSAGFLVLYLAETRSKSGLSQAGLSLIIAIGMGFQNLTEGLVFGSLGVVFGLSGATLTVFVGFILQNISEGFPIASPFLGKTEGKTGLLLMLFLIGAIPTIVGGSIGFFYNSPVFDLAFDGVAIGAILYAILPMLRALSRDSTVHMQRLSYLGVFVGFLLGFLVNLI